MGGMPGGEGFGMGRKEQCGRNELDLLAVEPAGAARLKQTKYTYSFEIHPFPCRGNKPSSAKHRQDKKKKRFLNTLARIRSFSRRLLNPPACAGPGVHGEEPADLVLPRQQRQAGANHLLPGRRERGAVPRGSPIRGERRG